MSIIIFVGCSVFIKMIIHYEISDDSDDNKIHRKRDTDNNAITRNHAILHAAKPRKIHWGKRSSDSVIYFRPGDLIGDEGKRSPCLRAGALTRTHTHTAASTPRNARPRVRVAVAISPARDTVAMASTHDGGASTFRCWACGNRGHVGSIGRATLDVEFNVSKRTKAYRGGVDTGVTSEPG